MRYEVKVPTAAGTGQVFDDTGQWRHYGASQRGTRFAPTAQINTTNVGQLEPAWTSRTGVPGEFKGTPIQIDDGLYCVPVETSFWRSIRTAARSAGDMIGNPVCANRVLGHLPWRHLLCQPARAGGQQLSERIITATTDARLIAVSKETGETCSDFGMRERSIC